MQRSLSPQQCRKIVVVKATVTYIYTAEGTADESRADSSGQFDGGFSVRDAVHAEGNANVFPESSDYIGHSGRGHKIHMPLIRKTKFIGNQNSVHTAILQRFQIR